jgi:hypothetical protein
VNPISRETISSAKPAEPTPAPVSKLQPITKAGVSLAKWLLVMISVFIGVAILTYLLEEISFNQRISAVEDRTQQLLLDKDFSTQNQSYVVLVDMKEQIISERRNFQDFWKNTVQIILLNVLLPVLTALLGYIFGSKEGS